MNKESENALQLLTGNTGFEETPVEELQQLADEHPYFAAAQLLLLHRMKQLQHENLEKQAQKTALYFPNEQWLTYLLPSDQAATAETPEGITVRTEPVTDRQPDETESATIEEERENTEPAIVETESREDVIADKAKVTEDNNLITLPAGQLLEDITDHDSIISEPEEMPLDEEELQQQAEKFPVGESDRKIASLLSEQAEQFHQPVSEDAKVTIATEPFHTVDYFASQGIKLDTKTDESFFDKKVHKFTDWLRQMKRINPQPVDLGTETEEEQHIASIADSSNYTKKVLTESMAEVLVKQGKPDKAIEIYQKLSLLNPDKSPYFAALIQKVK